MHSRDGLYPNRHGELGTEPGTGAHASPEDSLCSRSSPPAPGPHVSPGDHPTGTLGGAAGPSALCPPPPVMGHWSKAKPFLTCCVPSRTPAGLCWLLEQGRAPQALQTPQQRQQTLGRCTEMQLKAALGHKGLVCPAHQRPPTPHHTEHHAGTRCSTETLPNPHNSLFSTFHFLCMRETQKAQSPVSPAQPTWDGQDWPLQGAEISVVTQLAGVNAPWLVHPLRMGTGRQGHEPLSQLSPWPCMARNTAGNVLMLVSLLAQASPKSAGPDPCAMSPSRERQPGDAGTAEMSPSVVPSAVGNRGTSSTSKTALFPRSHGAGGLW